MRAGHASKFAVFILCSLAREGLAYSRCSVCFLSKCVREFVRVCVYVCARSVGMAGRVPLTQILIDRRPGEERGILL